MRLYGESRGHSALIDHVQIQLCQIQGGTHGGAPQGREQSCKGEESIAAAAVVEAESTNVEFDESIKVE